MMSKIESEIANAAASLRMEGLAASEEATADCRLVLLGEMTDTEYMARVRARYAEYITRADDA